MRANNHNRQVATSRSTWAVRMVFVGRPGTAMTVANSYVAYRLVRRGLHRLPP